MFNKLQKRNGGRGDEFTVREGGGTVRSLAGLRSHKKISLAWFQFQRFNIFLPPPRSGQVSEIMFVDKEREQRFSFHNPLPLLVMNWMCFIAIPPIMA